MRGLLQDEDEIQLLLQTMPCSDINLRLAFPLAVCINSIRKPLATQTIHFKAHPNVTHDLTDNACLIRGKRIGYISIVEPWQSSLCFPQTGSSGPKLHERSAAQPASLLKPGY